LLVDPFWFLKITMVPHILAHVIYSSQMIGVQNIKFILRTDLR